MQYTVRYDGEQLSSQNVLLITSRREINDVACIKDLFTRMYLPGLKGFSSYLARDYDKIKNTFNASTADR